MRTESRRLMRLPDFYGVSSRSPRPTRAKFRADLERKKALVSSRKAHRTRRTSADHMVRNPLRCAERFSLTSPRRSTPSPGPNPRARAMPSPRPPLLVLSHDAFSVTKLVLVNVAVVALPAHLKRASADPDRPLGLARSSPRRAACSRGEVRRATRPRSHPEAHQRHEKNPRLFSSSARRTI